MEAKEATLADACSLSRWASSSPSRWSQDLAGRRIFYSEALAATRQPFVSLNSYNHYVTARSAWAPRRVGPSCTTEEFVEVSESGLTAGEENAALSRELLWREALVSAMGQDEDLPSSPEDAFCGVTSTEQKSIPAKENSQHSGAACPLPGVSAAFHDEDVETALSEDALWSGKNLPSAVSDSRLRTAGAKPSGENPTRLQREGLEAEASHRRLLRLEETLDRLLDFQTKIHAQQLLLQKHQAQMLLRQDAPSSKFWEASRLPSAEPPQQQPVATECSSFSAKAHKPRSELAAARAPPGDSAPESRRPAPAQGSRFFGVEKSSACDVPSAQPPSAPVPAHQRFAKSATANTPPFQTPWTATAVRPPALSVHPMEMRSSPWFSTQAAPHLSGSRCWADLRVDSVSAAEESRPSSPTRSKGEKGLLTSAAESSGRCWRSGESWLLRQPRSAGGAGSGVWMEPQTSPPEPPRPVLACVGSPGPVYFQPLAPPRPAAQWTVTPLPSKGIYSPKTPAVQGMVQKCCAFRKRVSCKC